MIKSLSWEEILPIWKTQLWPNRISPIEPNSAMELVGGYSMYNMNTVPTFFGYYVDDKLVGVNSGHSCSNKMYRSRGLWVLSEHRGKGIGQQLLTETINQAKHEGSDMIWSFPKRTSWKTYNSVGFELASNWQKSETSDENAYCILKLTK
jgi:GNAT superfamily N-acetyltransferase